MLVDVQSSGMPVQVDDLDDGVVLELLRDAEVQLRQAERRKLRLATHWAERHAVEDPMEAAHWSDADQREVCEAIGGEGTPLVHEAAVAPLAAVLAISARTAMQLMSDALDLKHRLPTTFQAVEELALAPWRGRQIAQLTHRLSATAAAYVDTQVAPIADSAGRIRIERLVNDAAVRFDAQEQAVAEDAAKDAWEVTLVDYAGPVWAGTSRLEITGDTPTLHRFYDLVSTKAHQRLDPAKPADEQPSLEHRKVAAIGDLADGAGATCRTKLYLHLDAATMSDPVQKLGTVEKLGPLTTRTIKDWLGHSRFTLQPVLDLNRTDAVDGYAPPEWMRELVILRDRICIHPNCTKDARDCDLDHIEAYVEIDDGGPPGQTRPDNLAPLCRTHHRDKTHHGWSYLRNKDGTYTWTDPYGLHYTVDTRGHVVEH